MSEPVLESLSDLQKKDLRSLPWGYFSESDLERIYALAAQKWAQQQLENSNKMQAWGEVLREFHSSKYWGIAVSVNRPKPTTKASPTEAKKMFFYIWTAFQSLIVMKAIILFFGLVGVEDDRSDYKIYMLLAILFSFGNLIFFAYRNLNEKEE
jgi:hypothetical protein